VYESHKILGHNAPQGHPSNLKAQAQCFEGLMCSSEGLFAPATRPLEVTAGVWLASPPFFASFTPPPLPSVQKVGTKNV
jgi:hypothetical protein